MNPFKRNTPVKQFKENHTDQHIMDMLLIQDQPRFSELPPIKEQYDLEEVLSHFEQYNDIPYTLIDHQGLELILSDFNNIPSTNKKWSRYKNILDQWG